MMMISDQNCSWKHLAEQILHLQLPQLNNQMHFTHKIDVVFHNKQVLLA